MCLQYGQVALAFLLVHSLIGADGMMYNTLANTLAMFLIWGNAYAGNTSATFLLTARNSSKGVEIRLYVQETNEAQHLSGYEQKKLDNRYLSPECGDRFRRCSELTVVPAADPATTTASPAASVVGKATFVTILPLDRALGILKFTVGHLSGGIAHFIDLTGRNFSPSAVIQIEASYYVVCSNSELGTGTLLKLNLDTENIAKSRIPELEYRRFPPLHNVTNFLHVDLPHNTGHYIYFATGYRLLYIRPFDLVVGEVNIGLQKDKNRCFAKELGYTGDREMIVYCSDNQAMYVDIKKEYIWGMVEYAEDGRPYICPDHDVYLGVFSESGHILYGNRSTLEVKNFEAPMDIYDDGVCLGFKDTTLFAFTDRERGTRLLTAYPSGGYIRSLSDSACIDPCQPLVVLEYRYLVVREKTQRDWGISVFDSHNNFSLVLEAHHSQADLMAAISASSMTPELPTNGGTSPTTDLPREVMEDDNKILLLSFIIVSVVYIAIVAAVAVTMIILCMMR